MVPSVARDDAPIVAFDFDGTLTTHDSFVAFLRWRLGAWGWLRLLVRLIPSLAVYALLHDRERLKSACIRLALGGTPFDVLAQQADQFAAEHFATLMRPDALQTWNDHKAAGRRLAIVTASPEQTVAPFAVRLGAHALIGSRFAFTPEGRLCGMTGRNCRGQEKVTRLRDHFGPEVRVSIAYGDTSGDREMLSMAECGRLRQFVRRPTR